MYSALTLALLSQVSAFHLISTRSASQYHLRPIMVSSDGHLSLNGETNFVGELSDGVLTVNGKRVQLYEGFPIVGDVSDGSTWAFDQNDLTLDGKNAWVVCPGDNNNIAYAGQGLPSTCQDGVGIGLYSGDINGSAGDASSSGAETSATSTETSAATTETSAAATTETSTDETSAAPTSAAAGTTDVVEETVTETTCTHESCTATDVAAANGAARNGAVIGAVGAIAAALL